MIKYRNLTPFQKALLDSVLMEHEDVMEKCEPVVFSEQFLARSKKLIKQTRGVLSFGVKRGLRIALIAALITVLLAGCAMAIPAVREEVIDFFLQIDDEKVGITFDPQEAANAPKTIETTYMLSEIPPGYELVANESLSVQSYSWWMNDQGLWISYDQFTIPENAAEDNWIVMELPEMGRESRVIGDYLVEIIRSEGFYHLVWTNNKYAFVLELPDVIDDETMLKIFMSWQEVSPDDKSK